MANANTAAKVTATVETSEPTNPQTLPKVTKTVGTDELAKVCIRENIPIPRDIENMLLDKLKVACLMIHTNQSTASTAAESLFKGLDEYQLYGFVRSTVVQQNWRLIQSTKRFSLDKTMHDAAQSFCYALVTKQLEIFNAMPEDEQKSELTKAGKIFLELLAK